MEDKIYVLYRLCLEDWDNLELAVLNNGLALWGKVNPQSKTYARALQETLIKENGHPTDDCLVQAVTDEVGARVGAGTFH